MKTPSMDAYVIATLLGRVLTFYQFQRYKPRTPFLTIFFVRLLILEPTAPCRSGLTMRF